MKMIMKSIIAGAALFFALPAFSEENNNGSSDNSIPREEESVSSDTLCLALHLPVACGAIYGGEPYAAVGSNECVAIRNLVKDVNGRYAWFMAVRAEDLQELHCTPSHSE